MENQITFKIAYTEEDFEKCKSIIIEYLEHIQIETSYMNLENEFATITKKYGADEGVFILALCANEAIGCVGVRKIESEIAELKRLYVRESYRRLKIGICLLEIALENARNLGYKKIRLDVIPTLQKAKQMYFSFGFHEITPYFNNPVEGTTYMEKML